MSTSLGSHAVLVLLVLSVAGWLLFERRNSAAQWLVLWTAGAVR